MLVGHYAVALIAKRNQPKINLGTLVFAAMLADFAWCAFMILGLEQVQFKSGLGAGQYFSATNIALSHSLLMDFVWATLFGLAYFLRSRHPAAASTIFFVVLSHWFLDFVSHRPDLPFAPGTRRFVGLGLWNSIPATLLVEGAFWLFAILLFVRATHSRSRKAAFVFWAGISLLTLVWLSNIAGPPPQNPKVAPFASLIFFSLTLVWACWVNRSRVVPQARP